MKPTLILPIATAVLGFAAGWLLKPASHTPAPVVENTQRPTREPSSTPIQPADSDPGNTDTASTPQPPLENRKNPADALPKTEPPPIQARDEAKMARLSEALNLNDDQKAAISRLLAGETEGTINPEATTDPKKTLEDAAATGAKIEQAILALLTPEQAEAFTALRQRNLDNNIENTSQQQLSEVAKLVDLSPEQRQLAIDLLRDETRDRYQTRPAGLDLLLESSILPTGSNYISDNSVESLQHVLTSDAPANEAFHTFTDVQKASLDRQLTLYASVLTPAQLERLKVDIQERKQAIERYLEIAR